ncbi:MAG: alpha/beta hydrolase [Ilumatobacter sp.]|nr:MAG: alpha/beta hydrolase [Ilumatobacter sp.]
MSEDVTMRVLSSDEVEVVVHDLGGTGRPLLLSHATGFHGHCHAPMADVLADRFHSFALDYRGHGLTERPHDWQVDWNRYGDDALAAARAVAPDGGLVAFGHSMGGAGLLMAAHRDPGLFDLIVAFEPIVFPPPEQSEVLPPDSPLPNSSLAVGARRRRNRFASLDEAIANYAAKPPLAAFTPAALRSYVEHGFRPADDGDGVVLRCAPEHEARTFEQGNVHRTWDLLPEITTPVVVVAGARVEMSPAAFAELIARELPVSTYVQLDHLDHFGPMTHPDEVAELVADAVERLRHG